VKAVQTPKKNTKQDDLWANFDFAPKEELEKEGMDEAKFNAQFSDPFASGGKATDPFADDKEVKEER
jgi:hypothetical protein